MATTHFITYVLDLCFLLSANDPFHWRETNLLDYYSARPKSEVHGSPSPSPLTHQHPPPPFTPQNSSGRQKLLELPSVVWAPTSWVVLSWPRVSHGCSLNIYFPYPPGSRHPWSISTSGMHILASIIPRPNYEPRN